MHRPVFADPKNDLMFRRIFGNEAHKSLLVALLNDLLGLDGERRVLDLRYLSPEQVPPLEGHKFSIVDVKCVDARGIHYVVEMQMLNVEGFEKRLVYNLCNAYAMQLRRTEQYPTLDDVVAVAICDFVLWPPRAGEEEVPMLSRWHMTEESTGLRRFSQMRYAVLELPKYRGGTETAVDRWAWFFREAERLEAIPDALQDGPIGEALEVARTARFSLDEWEAYEQAAMAEQDARGALSLARSEGEAKGRATGKADALLLLLGARGLPISEAERRQILSTPDLSALDRWFTRAVSAASVAEVLA